MVLLNGRRDISKIELSDSVVIESMRLWVEKMIVGLNFCPFAKREVVKDRVRYAVINAPFEGSEHQKAFFFDSLDLLIKECRLLDDSPEIETTLVVYPELLQDFDIFLDYLLFAEKTLLDHDYEGVYQLAHFHPEYCFEGQSPEDPANYTNRSPYPVLHIIREAGLENVLANIDQPEEIPERNIKFARAMGSEQLSEILKACYVNHD